MKITFYTIIFIVTISCVPPEKFDIPKENCNDSITTNKTIKDIFTLATTTVTKYNNDDFIEAYIVSSDQGGNFFKSISMQTIDGSLGLRVPIDQTDMYTIYNPGRKVYIKLKNKYFEIDNNALEIGDLFIGNFLNESVGRIAYPNFEETIIKSCEIIDENSLINTINIDSISNNNLHTLLEFHNVQFTEDALGSDFYDSDKDDFNATNHFIEDTKGAKLAFRTSSFANFAQLEVPRGNGTIRGVLTKFDGEYQLLARTINDIQLNNERLNIVITLKNNVFFTELADPNNNSSARFIEIYNGDNETIDLKGWRIIRYTNDNTTSTSSIDLTGSKINSGQAFVIAAQAAEFEAVFGFPPDLDAGTGGPADSNGDDNLVLIDSEGNIVDIFGAIGEDGTGTNHEFEDGRALRNMSVVQGSPIYAFSEWQIWNDSGNSGTINSPQDAPDKFTPGVR